MIANPRSIWGSWSRCASKRGPRLRRGGNTRARSSPKGRTAIAMPTDLGRFRPAMTQIDRFRPAASKQSRSAWASAGLVGLAALAVLALGGADADARGRSRIKHPIHGASYHPPYADIVID